MMADQLLVALPPGYRFDPTDKELIIYYLRNKVSGQPLPALNVIPDRNLYGSEEPSEYGDPNGDLYFFTKIKNKFANTSASRIDRSAGKGTWRIQNSPCVYDTTDGTTVLLGFKKSLNFIEAGGVKKSQDAKSWIMHEYTLPEHQYPHHHAAAAAAAEQWALCRIRRGKDDSTKSRKRPRVEKNSNVITSLSSASTTTPDPIEDFMKELQDPEVSKNIAMQIMELYLNQEEFHQKDIIPSASSGVAAMPQPQPQPQPCYKEYDIYQRFSSRWNRR